MVSNSLIISRTIEIINKEAVRKVKIVTICWISVLAKLEELTSKVKHNQHEKDGTRTNTIKNERLINGRKISFLRKLTTKCQT